MSHTQGKYEDRTLTVTNVHAKKRKIHRVAPRLVQAHGGDTIRKRKKENNCTAVACLLTL